jgi:hypothetical protein
MRAFKGSILMFARWFFVAVSDLRCAEDKLTGFDLGTCRFGPV